MRIARVHKISGLHFVEKYPVDYRRCLFLPVNLFQADSVITDYSAYCIGFGN